VPLYPKFPLFFIPGASVAVRLEDFLILITLAVWLLVKSGDIYSLLKKRVVQNVLFFLFVGLVSVLLGAYLTKTLSLPIGILHWLRRVEYLSVFVIAMSTVKSEKDISFYIKILLVVIIYAFVYGVGQKYFDLPVITTQNQEYSKGIALKYLPGGHLVSTFAGHYDLAMTMVFFAPVLYILLFTSKKNIEKIFFTKKHLLIRIVLTMIILAGLWLLVQAASRISVVSYLIAASSALVMIKRIRYIPVVLILIILFVSMSSNLIDRYINIFEVAVTNAQDVPLRREIRPTPTPAPPPPFEDRSTSIRLNVEWPRAVRSIRKNPFFGTGYSSITLATDNDYLRMLGETGVFGFLSFSFLMVNISLLLFRKVMESKNTDSRHILYCSILAALPPIFLSMLFVDILEASKFAIVFWGVLGLGVGAAYGKQSS